MKIIKKYNTLSRKTKTTVLDEELDNNVEENYEESINKIKNEIKNIKRCNDGNYYINDKVYKKLTGPREEVYNEIAYKTTGGLTKDDLVINRRGNLVSKKKCIQETKINRLEAFNLKKKNIIDEVAI